MANHQEIPESQAAEIAQLMIFKNLWRFLPNKSFVSGLWLRTYVDTAMWQNCFLRVLDEAKYRYFRYYYRNLVLVTPGERGLWLQGSEEERIQYALTVEEQSRGKCTADWDKIKEREKILMDEYKKYFPITRGMLINYKYSLQEESDIIGRLNKKFIAELK